MTDDDVTALIEWLEHKSALLTGSLHCGDNSITINRIGAEAAQFDKAAAALEQLWARVKELLQAGEEIGGVLQATQARAEAAEALAQVRQEHLQEGGRIIEELTARIEAANHEQTR